MRHVLRGFGEGLGAMCAFLLFVIIAATARVEADRRMFAAMFGGSKK